VDEIFGLRRKKHKHGEVYSRNKPTTTKNTNGIDTAIAQRCKIVALSAGIEPAASEHLLWGPFANLTHGRLTRNDPSFDVPARKSTLASFKGNKIHLQKVLRRPHF
jgi:hypothetical protein